MQGDLVTVLQDGKPVNVKEEELHKGDHVLLQAGDLVPADLELTEARGLEVDEWGLTGEILPVEKHVAGDDVYVYRGSQVTRGNGIGIVVATGDETEYAQCLKQSWERTPYERPPLFTRKSLLVLVLLLPPIALTLLRYNHDAIFLLLGAALVVMAVLLENSGLFEYFVTVHEARTLQQRGICIRDVRALEVLERVNVVCLDETGVMTTRDLRVRGIHLADAVPDLAYFGTGEEVATLTRLGCALCNDVAYAEKANLAGPVDRALITFARQNGTDIAAAHREYRRVYDRPFDSEKRYMACGFAQRGSTLYFAKGDPEVVLKMCGSYVSPAGEELNTNLRFWMNTETHRKSISKIGDVAIALAYAVSTAENFAETPPLSYTFLCLVQLENPLQPDVPSTLRKLREEGIRTLMVTADRSETALKIGAEAGLVTNENLHLTGRQMAAMNMWDIGKLARFVSIFTQLLPSQKGLLIRSLQQKQEVVAMVGDGANDTVALRVADVGIAFGRDSSPLAKRVAPILIDDLTDLVTVVQGARKIRERLSELAAMRAMLLLITFLALYGWVFLQYMVSR